MSTDSIKEPQRKATDDHAPEIEASSAEISDESNKNVTKEKENEKPKSLEVVLNMDEKNLDEHKKGINDKNSMVCGYHGPTRVPTTYVYFQTVAGQNMPANGPPLDYTPDRNEFVRLVFTIVLIMLSVTASFIMIVFMMDPIKDFFLTYGLLFGLMGMVIMVGLNYAMACSACTRQPPCNVICLGLAVIGMSSICAFITVRYDTSIVFLAAIATTGVVLFCLLLAYTSFDFTKWLLFAVLMAVALCVVTCVAYLYMMISGNSIKPLHLGLLCIAVLLNVVFLTIELQMILGGKTVELAEDDFALGAYMLYTSIIDIFIKLVQIFGILDDM